MKAKVDVLLVPWDQGFEVHIRTITITDVGATQAEDEGQVDYMVRDYVNALFDGQLDVGLVTVSRQPSQSTRPLL